MCRHEIDVQLCAFEAALPFLKASLGEPALDREIAGFRAELMPQAADSDERREIEERMAAALRAG